MPANIEVDIIQSCRLKVMIKLLAYYMLTETLSPKNHPEGLFACFRNIELNWKILNTNLKST